MLSMLYRAFLRRGICCVKEAAMPPIHTAALSEAYIYYIGVDFFELPTAMRKRGSFHDLS